MKDYWKGLMIGMVCGILSVSAGIAIAYRTSSGGKLFSLYSSEGVLSDAGHVQKLDYIEGLIDRDYLYDVDQEAVEEGIYAGMIAGLQDPYSRYYTSEQYKEESISSEGNYSGVGIVMEMGADGIVTIVQVYEGSPAEREGILSGDVITAVDGNDVSGMDLSEVADLVRNTGKDSVTLTLHREEDTLEITVPLEKIEIPSVSAEMLDDETGYIRITEFTGVAADQYLKAFESLSGQGLEKLVVDLRNNPGGYVTTVCDILRHILPEGVIFYTEDKDGNRVEETCDGKNRLEIPLCVLVNENSASASEIFAGSVKDYGAGTLVGTTTYGKGVVQSIIPLTDGSAVKLTNAEYFTPLGNKIHKIGITPDVVCGEGEESFREDLEHEKDVQLQKALEILNSDPENP